MKKINKEQRVDKTFGTDEKLTNCIVNMRKSILIGIAIALTAMVAVGCKSSPKETVYDVYVAGSEAHDPFWKTVLWVNGKSASAPSANGG